MKSNQRHAKRARLQAVEPIRQAKEEQAGRLAQKKLEERVRRRVQVKREVQEARMGTDVAIIREVINLTGELSEPPPRFEEDGQWGACVSCKRPVDKSPEHRTCGLAICLTPARLRGGDVHCLLAARPATPAMSLWPKLRPHAPETNQGVHKVYSY